jgi:hypothetical protein
MVVDRISVVMVRISVTIVGVVIVTTTVGVDGTISATA